MAFFLLDAVLEPLDIVISMLLIFLSLTFAVIYKKKKIYQHPRYKYYVIGMMGKILGAIGICSVYTYYYTGGDINYYHESSVSIKNILLQKGFSDYFTFIFGTESDSVLYSYFDSDVGVLQFWLHDKYCIFVCKLSSILELFCLGQFYSVNILIAVLSYSGLWKIYSVFEMEFPQLRKILAYFILLSPSVLFWSSGLNKDSYCFWSVGYVFYFLYQFRKTGSKKHLFYLVFPLFIILNIKPYIIIAIIPASLAFFVQNITLKFRTKFMRIVILPIVAGVLFSVFLYVYNTFSSYFGDYALDNVIKKAQVIQEDLLRDQYGSNKFDIGKIGNSPIDLLLKFFPAVNATLFRPYIWESNNILMFFSGVENFIVLAFSVYGLLKFRVANFFKILFSHSILTFSFIYALLFGFSIGLSIANFGALVRLKIPAAPFFLATVIIIGSSKNLSDKNKEAHFHQ